MRLHYFLLHHLVEEFALHLRGAVVSEVITRKKNVLEVYFTGGNELYRLFIDISVANPVIFLEQGNPPASNKVQLFDALPGNTVQDVKLRKTDRIIDIAFNSGKILTICVFGSLSNVFLIENELLTTAFKKKAVPDVIKFNCKESETTDSKAADPRLPKELTRARNNAGATENSVWIDEALHRPVFNVWENGFPSVWTHPDLTAGTFASAGDMVRALYFEQVQRSGFGAEKETLLLQIQALMRKIEHRLTEESASDTLLVRAERLRQRADSLLSLPEQTQLAVSLEMVVNVYDPNDIFAVPVESGKTVRQIALQWYGKAKRHEMRAATSGQRMVELQAEVYRLETLLVEAREVRSLPALEKIRKRLSTSRTSGAGEPSMAGVAVYQISGFEIWVGKSAAGNEIILQKSQKEDIWMHARGVSGSHVVVRNPARLQTIPKNVLETAASWAGWRSKDRGSALVPVQFTRRKFVRKPKGGAPGMVLVQREEVLLVKPVPDNPSEYE